MNIGAKEDGMSGREIRAVLMDVHGVPFEKKTDQDNPRLVGEQGRAFWASCAERAINKIFGKPVSIDPMRLWETRCEIELRTPRVEDGKVIPQRDYWDRINRLVLEALEPEVMGRGVPSTLKVRAARAMRGFHREDHPDHTMYHDMRGFLHWIHDVGLKLYFQTAQEERRVWELVRSRNAPVSCIDGVFTTHRLGFSKLRREFWLKILDVLQMAPEQVIVVGNNAIQDTYCTAVAVSVLILDRDGEQERWCRSRGQHLRGAALLSDSQEIPERGKFIGFAQNGKQLQRWLERMCYTPGGEIDESKDTKKSAAARS